MDKNIQPFVKATNALQTVSTPTTNAIVPATDNSLEEFYKLIEDFVNKYCTKYFGFNPTYKFPR
jgi:hypothetical protein